MEKYETLVPTNQKGFNPLSLKFLAAVQVPADSDKGMLPQELHEYQAKVQETIKNPTFALWKTLEEQDYDMSAYLIGHGADIKEKRSEMSFIHSVAKFGNEGLLNLLFCRGVPINEEGIERLLPVDCALLNGNKQTARYLIGIMKKKKCKKVLASNLYGSSNFREQFSTLDLAHSLGYQDVVELICENTRPLPPRTLTNKELFTYAVFAGVDRVVKEKIENNEIDINKIVVWGKEINPLKIAAAQGYVTMLDFLIKYSIQQKTLNEFGLSALLFYAAQDRESTKYLLENGADANIQDNNFTPLHVAASCGNSDVIELLIQYGVPVDVKDSSEATPLHRAAFFNHANAVKILLEHGAIAQTIDKFDRTPLEETKSSEIAVLLQAQGAKSRYFHRIQKNKFFRFGIFGLITFFYIHNFYHQ